MKMKTADPTTPSTSEMGTSKGMMTMRPMRSQTVTTQMPARKTQGMLVRRSSPRTIETRFGTMRPRNGSAPTTTVTTPVTRETRPTPSSTTRS